MNLECKSCHRMVSPYEISRQGVCHDCMSADRDKSIAEERERELKRQAIILVTTQTVAGEEIDRPLGIVSAQVAFGMNVLKDIATMWRDAAGGRAKSLQGILADSRKQVLADLAEEARLLDADAVVGIDIDMSEFSVGNGMVLMIATGTAVRLVERQEMGAAA